MSDSIGLSCAIHDDEIVIRIGIGVLARAAENHPDFWEPDQPPKIEIIDEREFAVDVANELSREDEIGASAISRMIDQAIVDAYENGSTACKE